MSVHHTCGNCRSFVHIKAWGSGRNGICGKHDWSCSMNYGKSCQDFDANQYDRRQSTKNTEQELNALVR